MLKFDINVSGDVCFFRGCILSRHFDCELVPINPDNSFELLKQRLREKAGAAIGVHEQFLTGWNESRDQVAQGIGDSVVCLGENAGAWPGTESVMTVFHPFA